MARKMARLKRALEITGYARSQFYKKIAEGVLPPPVKLDPNGRASVWFEDELELVQKRAESRRLAEATGAAKEFLEAAAAAKAA